MALNNFQQQHFASGHYGARHFRGPGKVRPKRPGGAGAPAGWRRSVPTPSWREQEDEEVVMALIAAYLEIEHET